MMGEFVVLDDIPAARLAMKCLMEAKEAATSVLDQVEVEDRRAPGPEGAPDVTLTIIRPKDREAVAGSALDARRGLRNGMRR